MRPATSVLPEAPTVADRGPAEQYARFLTALDADQMRPILAETLGGSGETCVVLDAKFEVGRPAVLLYRLGDRLVHATVPVGAAGVELSAFHHDPALPGLPWVVEQSTLTWLLQRALPEAESVVASAHARLLRYRPGRRATFLVEAEVVHCSGQRSERFVAKVYHDPAKAGAVVAEGRALAAHPHPAPLVLAAVLGHAEQQGVVFQQHLPGAPLVLALRAEAAEVEKLRRAARALAAWHELCVPVGRPRPVERERERFVSRAAGIRSVEPEIGAPLLDLAHRIRALPLPSVQPSLVHGDCKPSQFLIHADTVALLDLDHCGVADPASDLGNLLASLRQQALQDEPARLDTAVRLGEELTEAYLRSGRGARGADLPSRIELYVSVALLRKALRAFARSPWSPAVPRLVDEAHRGLDQLRMTGGQP